MVIKSTERLRKCKDIKRPDALYPSNNNRWSTKIDCVNIMADDVNKML